MHILPELIVGQYDLVYNSNHWFISLEMSKAIYELPESGKPSNHHLQGKLRPAGYCEVTPTSGLWKHVTWQVQFTLLVNDFGVKYLVK